MNGRKKEADRYSQPTIQAAATSQGPQENILAKKIVGRMVMIKEDKGAENG